ncbi:MAG: B12-binding domain-containing radical SAM protein [Candidatus Heimdallarchaeota archaeon]|nr:MAG: B12-binding domain-containing radical SAM protein [Candidatus Heimdallarchaeota archaeon]
MRVLLIKPTFYTALAILVDEIPIGLEYIASAIKSKVDKVVIADVAHDNIDIKREIRQVKPDIIGITGQMAWHNEIVQIARTARKSQPSATIIAGGYYPSLFPQLLKIIPEIDLIVRGEGENTFTEICENGTDDLSGIKGLIFRDGDQIVSSGTRPLIQNLDSLKFPARNLRRSYYTHMQFPGRYYDVITTTRGCVGRCSFCCEPDLYGKPRRRSAKNVFAEIDQIVHFHQNSPMEITITDPNFMGRTKDDAERIYQLCDLLEERQYDLSFSILARADMVARNPELVKRMVQNGFFFYELGIEAPDPLILKNTKKGESLNTMINSVKIVNDAGGFPLGTLMLGFSGQNEEIIKQYPSYAHKLGLREAAFALATPLIGSGFFDEVKENIFEKNFARYNYLHPTFNFNSQISKNKVYYLLGYCYGGFYNPSAMNRNEEFYRRLLPSGYRQISLETYLKFAFKALREFPNHAKITFLKGAITGYLATRKSEHKT